MIRHTLQQAVECIRPVSDSPLLDAQLLLAEVLGTDRSYLIAHDEDQLTSDQQAAFMALVERRAAGEPIAYILGRKPFYDLEFTVAPGVLIPRPETELLLEIALQHAATLESCVAADIGTGSGALAVSFAVHQPQARVYAIDLSPQALEIAHRNVARYGAEVEFLEGDLLAPLIERGIKADILMANLPYIASAELDTLAVSRHEPHLALDGGLDGLELIRRLLGDLRQVCETGALALLEIGADQGGAVLQLAASLQPQQAEIQRDYAGLDRILRIVL